MKRILTCCGLLVGTLTFAEGALAAPTVQGLTLGVERVFGFTTSTLTDEGDVVTNTTSLTGFSLGNTGRNTLAGYSVPRVNVDYILPMGLSFGGAFGLSTVGFRSENKTGQVTVTNEATLTGFLFAPRVGYMIGLNEQFGIWPRGGFSYIYASTTDEDADNDNGDTSTGYGALTLEVPFVFAPTKSFGFVATPALDLGVAGSRETGGEEYDGDLSLTEFGITLGLFVAF
jgi:hypothetical protein